MKETGEVRPIDRYGAIGDGRSVALVSDVGSIDWLCWPRVDSPAIFAALLDPTAGAFKVAALDGITKSRQYLEGTNVLVTTFRGPRGTLELVDFMPIGEPMSGELSPEREIVRRARCVEGEVDLEIAIDPRRDFGMQRPRARHAPHAVRWDGCGTSLFARSGVPLAIEGATARARVSLRREEHIDTSLSHSVDGPAVLPAFGARVDAALTRTSAWWAAWSARARYRGPYRAAVVRSALALKLLCYAPSGAIIAAPTTSLPERLGGPLNWDYRFCWLRDASLTTRALFGLGYVEEAVAFVSWLLHATRLTWPRLAVLYDVYGRRPPTERELPQLSGYVGSRPVRVGNAAADQLQLDVYGEVIDAAAQVAQRLGALDRETQEMLCGLADTVTAHRMEADHGIWESRGKPQHHTHSRLLSWVALDRMLSLERDGFIAPLRCRDHYESARAAIRRDIESRAWNDSIRAYTGVLDGSALDASVLLLSHYGFEPPTSPRMRATWTAIHNALGTPRGLRRYVAAPGWEEGAFGICSFWGVEYLARAGRLRDADAALRQLLPTGNHLGLFAEEVDPYSGALLGNFPQAFTHVGLINAALTIEEARATRRGADRHDEAAA